MITFWSLSMITYVVLEMRTLFDISWISSQRMWNFWFDIVKFCRQIMRNFIWRSFIVNGIIGMWRSGTGRCLNIRMWCVTNAMMKDITTLLFGIKWANVYLVQSSTIVRKNLWPSWELCLYVTHTCMSIKSKGSLEIIWLMGKGRRCCFHLKQMVHGEIPEMPFP